MQEMRYNHDREIWIDALKGWAILGVIIMVQLSRQKSKTFIMN